MHVPMVVLLVLVLGGSILVCCDVLEGNCAICMHMCEKVAMHFCPYLDIAHGCNICGLIHMTCISTSLSLSLSLSLSFSLFFFLSLSLSLSSSTPLGVFLAFPDLSLGDNNKSQSSDDTKRTQPCLSSRSIVGAILCMTATIEENPVVSTLLCDNISSNRQRTPVPLGGLKFW